MSRKLLSAILLFFVFVGVGIKASADASSQITVVVEGPDRVSKSLDNYAVFHMAGTSEFWAYCSGKDELYVVQFGEETTFFGVPYSNQIAEAYVKLSGCESGKFDAIESLRKQMTVGQMNTVTFSQSSDPKVN